MAYVAFDLDNTLGYFDILAPVAHFWSPEVRRSPPIAAHNPPLKISVTLEKKLRRARSRFASSLLRYPELLKKILRPNLSDFIEPLLEAKAARKLKAVIIYSNTLNYYTMELAKTLIERLYKCPGLFKLIADAYHPLRKADYYDPYTNEPLKTFDSVERLFQEATSSRRLLHPSEIAFVDDRDPVHDLMSSTPQGLVYIQPTHFVASYTIADRKTIFRLAIEALRYVRLTSDIEYHMSGFCNLYIPTGIGSLREIIGPSELLDYVWMQVSTMPNPSHVWRRDAGDGQKLLSLFMRRF
jgi:hypothetical protein